MCAHSSSASDIIEKIGQKLYPFIAEQFSELNDYNRKHNPCASASLLFELVQNLKAEFESLRNYEIKLVFPSVQEVFNTKDDPGFKPSVNINELQLLTQKKETIIKELVDELQQEAENINLKKMHPAYGIVHVFNEAFLKEKLQWHKMLNSWNKGCACFSKANQVVIKEGNISGLSNHPHGTR
jgi:O-phosphoseryl-tRNA(Cys) synthetase